MKTTELAPGALPEPLPDERGDSPAPGGIVYRSDAMGRVLHLARSVSRVDTTVLLTGESGVGKELIARLLHQQSARARRPFVAVNCGALPEPLLESELFGHVRGAFTGATDTKVGLFEYAHGGTIFLDEIGELPLAVQAKLLRVMESGDLQRVGAVESRRVDVHILAATNRDLRAEVDAGRFRSDLFYRMNVVELHVPPLRERREDVPYLVAALVREFSARFRKRIAGVTPSAERLLMSAPWEGNVRELRNVIERACLLAEGELITEREIAEGAGRRRRMGDEAAAPAETDTRAPADAEADAPESDPTADSLKARERDHVLRVLEESRGNKKAAAARLGVSRRALYRLLDRHALDQHVHRRAPGAGRGDAGRTVEHPAGV
jgi:transcriptional regulator with GAF, ATPase, and Fis domain